MYTYILDISRPETKGVDVNTARRLRVKAILQSLSDTLEAEREDHALDPDFDVALYTSVIDAAALFQGMDREMVACELLAFFRQKRRESRGSFVNFDFQGRVGELPIRVRDLKVII